MDHLKIEFPTEAFDSVPKLLARSAALYFATLPWLAAITWVVFLPAKYVLQVVFSALEIGESSVAAYALSGLSDLLLSALVTPALVYLLIGRLRTGRPAPLGESMKWGWSLWGKCLWNDVKAEVTIALWGLLIIIPGVVAAVRLCFVDVVVSVEGKQTADPLARSRELAAGREWRIFSVLLVLGVVYLLVWGGVLRLRLGMALTDSLMAVVSEWSMVAVLLIYLGITRASARP